MPATPLSRHAGDGSGATVLADVRATGSITAYRRGLPERLVARAVGFAIDPGLSRDVAVRDLVQMAEGSTPALEVARRCICWHLVHRPHRRSETAARLLQAALTALVVAGHSSPATTRRPLAAR